jgi:Na+-translocating ferredoxin:NAD+ oxidoreductase RnfA subunit
MTPLIIALSILAALLIGCAVMLILFAAFRPSPLVRWHVHPPVEAAQMPVVEAGIVSYQFLGVTGEEQP